jgi:3-deoxy-7-phosphoheptulonate synthase
MPVGFKNGTDGGLEVAINALQSAAHPHAFLGIIQDGQVFVIRTTGNQYDHVVLRGGNGKPNYDSVRVAQSEQALEKSGVTQNIMIDCSHANSNKQPELQPLVMENVANQILEGNRSIVGLMIESHLNWGNQKISDNMEYGVSVTDACIDWATTENSIKEMAAKLRDVLPNRNA